MRILLQRPETQAGKIQFMGIPGGAGARMRADVTVCSLQRINDTERGFRGMFAQVLDDRLVAVLLGQFTRHNRFGPYRRAPDLVALSFPRKPSK